MGAPILSAIVAAASIVAFSSIEAETNTRNVPCMAKDCRTKMCSAQLRLQPETIEMRRCLCSFDCSFRPDWQCSTDGHSFLNPCVLQSRSCLLNRNITIAYSTQCRHGHRGSCAGVYCSLGTRCAVVDGTPTCVCSTSCPLRDGPKTCGSDDVLYANECYMKALACRLGRRHLSVVRYGRCREKVQSRPCDRLKCVDVCVENRNGATCLCTATCLPGGRRVCGTNGVTYANECMLKLASCRAGVGRSIEVEQMGLCPPKPNVCRGANCDFNGGTCVEREGKAHCLCAHNCKDVANSLCGANGKTYRSHCQLRFEACQMNVRIAVAHLGTCQDPCQNVRCGLGRKCFDANGKAECQCYDDCEGENKTIVCGSDGNTYTGECAMLYEACTKDTTVTVSYSGECDPCHNVTCLAGKKCSTKTGKPVCACRPHSECPRRDAGGLVCGSDGKTYANECVLKAKACARNETVTISAEGKCPKDPCKESGLSCQFYEICDTTSGRPRCACPQIDCSSPLPDYVCGSDGRTYRSGCSLRRKSCAQRRAIREVKKGRC